jgi:hypothetical protein
MNFAFVSALVLLAYVVFVATAEMLIGVIQPDMEDVVVLTTTDAQDNRAVRKLAGFHHNDALYISSNHWLRGWYRRALENPDVEVTFRGDTAPYSVVRVRGAERKKIAKHYKMGFVLRFICGFAPSRFVRLDPR